MPFSIRPYRRFPTHCSQWEITRATIDKRGRKLISELIPFSRGWIDRSANKQVASPVGRFRRGMLGRTG
jgi:hypothetical protein